MTSPELGYARNQMKGWESETKRIQNSIDNVEIALAATDILTEIAIMAIVSAATLGLATYFSSTYVAGRVGTSVAKLAQSESAALQTITRVAAGVGSGTTATLSAAQLGEAFGGIASRMLAAPIVSGASMCIRQALRGGTIDKIFVKQELLYGMAFSAIFAWIGAPGPKTPVRSGLIKHLTDTLPSWRHALTGRIPSAQALVVGGNMVRVFPFVVGGKMLSKIFRKVFDGEFSLDTIKLAMRADGFSLDSEIQNLAKISSSKMQLWALTTAAQVATQARRNAQNRSYYPMVGAISALAHHAVRETFLGDASMDYRLRIEYTELYAAVASRDYWSGVVQFHECLEEASRGFGK